jgi:peptide/nickel transport system permease protein
VTRAPSGDRAVLRDDAVEHGAMPPSDEARVADSPRRSAWRRLRRHRPALLGSAVLVAEITLALMAPIVIPEDRAVRPNPTRMLQRPSASHALGTDEVGRDILARLVYAGRISLAVGILAAVVSVTVGTTVGAVAGYYAGWADNLLMRLTDALLSIPVLFFVIVLTVLLGPNPRTLIIVIGALTWMDLARIIRANFLSLKQKEFTECARAIGVGDPAIIFRHILPNTLAPIVVAGTFGVGQAMLAEAAVSYLGLGIQPPTPSWGNMLFNAQSYLWNAPWVALYPGSAILMTVLSINFIGDGLRDALDPRMSM